MLTKVEQVVSLPVINPATGRPSRTFRYMGKIDAISGTTLVDWKTTGDPYKFVTEIAIGCQAELYAMCVLAEGVKIDSIEYRLVRRPTIKYKVPRFTFRVYKPGRKTAVAKFDNMDAAQEKVLDMDGGTIEESHTGNIDRDDYESEGFQWILDQDDGLVTHVYHLTESKLRHARQYLWDMGQKLLDARRNARWVPNEKACFACGRPCEFLPVCELKANGADYEEAIREDYFPLESTHRELNLGELSMLEGTGGGLKPISNLTSRNILTYSSLGVLNTCELKYYWRHERGLSKHAEEGSESLWVGSATHVGMEALAKGGMDAARETIEVWAEANPVLGEDQFRRQEQRVARALACVRAAAAKWMKSDDHD